MEKNKKQSEERDEFCRAEADEVKYMMLLNAINESNTEEDTNNISNLKEKRQSKSSRNKGSNIILIMFQQVSV